MERIRNQKHSKDTVYYSLSRMFERTSFYGIRGLLILYMSGEILKMDRSEAFKIYGVFAGAIVFSQIIGALLGDLVIGNRKTIVIGGILQALGAFSLCIPSIAGLYTGLVLVVLGSGFYTPNIISNFGKLYLSKTKLLDSGFTLFYLAVNVGSFLGVLLVVSAAEKFGTNVGFILSGILMLLSVIPVLFAKVKVADQSISNELTIGKRVINISIAFIVVAIFWQLYLISDFRSFFLKIQFSEISSLNIPKSLWHSANEIFVLPIGIIATVAWTYFYSTHFFKLMMGFIFGAISIGFLILIPETPTAQHTVFYVLSLVCLGISEIHIAPILHSLLTKYLKPQYLAIGISLTFVASRLIYGLSVLSYYKLYDKFYVNPLLGSKFAFITMTLMSIGLMGFVLWKKKASPKRE
ncbi:MAG: POT family proton-dependent oligopeptide transporter [Bacteroidia bacterium]|jgi:POT family proton-dependent oligopeptide transporter